MGMGPRLETLELLRHNALETSYFSFDYPEQSAGTAHLR